MADKSLGHLTPCTAVGRTRRDFSYWKRVFARFFVEQREDRCVSESNESNNIPPPKWMTKPERRGFESIKDARKVAGNPVSAAEIDLLSDYVSARSRLAVLRRLLKRNVSENGDSPSFRDQGHIAGLIRQADSSTGLARRLAKQLGLAPDPITKESK
jgi:hypothetical protein